MTKLQNSPAPQAPARKRRNTYRNLAIEFYARNSSSILAITHQHWPNQPWTSQPELARIFSIRQTATRKYDMPNRIDFCLTPDGLPVACEVPLNASLSGAPAVRTEKASFNPEYLTSDGKIDKVQLFGYILADGRKMALPQLRQVVMKVANIRSFNFAFRVIDEAHTAGLGQTLKDGTNTYYQLVT